MRPPLQQPAGHEFASHTHKPVVLSHSRFALHAPHCWPAWPHEAVDSLAYTSQVPAVPPLQQPFGHVLLSHSQTPVVVSQRLLPHGPQAPPPFPHWDGVWEGYVTH